MVVGGCGRQEKTIPFWEAAFQVFSTEELSSKLATSIRICR